MNCPPRLLLELIPQSAFGANLRTLFSAEYRQVKLWTHERAGMRCECCERRKGPEPRKDVRTLECHERWSYDEATGIQQLEDTLSLCALCHMCFHPGLAKIQGKEELTRNWMQKVNGWSVAELDEHLAAAWSTWRRRSAMTWSTDATRFLATYRTRTLAPLLGTQVASQSPTASPVRTRLRA